MRSTAIIALALLGGCHLLFESTVKASTDDEDLDDVINVEDNCPGIANPGQEDFDQDGVGDACDPSNDRIDTIVHRSFFNGDDAVPWPTPEGWKLQGGSLVAREPTDVQAFLQETPPGRSVVVELGFEVSAWTEAKDDAVGVRVDGPGGPLCALNEFATDDVRVVLTTDAAANEGDARAIGAVPLGTRLQLRFSVEQVTGHLECTFGSAAPVVFDRPMLQRDSIGLLIQHAEARIRYVLVYASDD